MFAILRIAPLRGFTAAAILSLISACGGGGGKDEISLSRIEVTPALASVPAGTSQQYVATAVYSDDSSKDVTQTATWTSSAPAIATVSDLAPGKGNAQTLSAGVTTIAAQLDGTTGSTTLTVRAAAPTALAVTPASPVIAKGTRQQFVATATFTDGSVHDVTDDATWTSSKTTVATVGSTGATGGLAFAAGVGTTQIQGLYEGIGGSASLTVTAATVASVAVTPSATSKPKGTSLQLVATATLSDGTTQNVTSQATWTSSAPAVASVSDGAASKGLTQALAVGSARLSAAFSGSTGGADLSVTAAELVSISVTPPAPSVPRGLKQQFTATGVYTDSSTADLTTQVTWSSSNPGVATISNAAGSSGSAQTAGEGSSTITATQPSTAITGTATLAVTAVALSRVEVTPTTPNVPNGSTQQFKATGYYTDNSFQDLTQSATWSVADTAIADIGNANGSRGLAVAKSVGSTDVLATVGGQSGTTTMIVTSATLSAIQVTPANQLLAAGYTRQFTATGIYSDNSTRDVTAIASWTTTTAAFATVSNASDSKGLVTGVSAGTVNVAAAIESISGLTPLTVTNASVTSVAVTPDNPTIPLGTSQQFIAIATFSDGSTQDMSTQSSWSSSQPSIASISNSAGSQGKATAESIGNTEISAQVGGWIDRTGLSVSAATLSKITITPNPATVAKGSTLPLTATGTYSDNSTKDVTGDVTWNSSDTSIATVTNGSGGSGVVKGVKEGTVTIGAALGTITGTIPFNVGSAVLSSIAVTPADQSVAKGVPVQYAATGTYSDGTVADITGAVTWSSDTPAVATVSNAADSKGLASTAGTGTTNITAVAGTISGATVLTVTAKTLNAIAVTPANPTIPNGTTQQFTATASYSDGSTANLSNSVTWSSSSGAVADVSNAPGTQGLATSKTAGTTTIKATSGSVSGSVTLTVTAAALQLVTVTPASGSIPAGYFLQYRATGSYADGSTKDITGDVSWSVFNEAVANVSNATGSKGRVSAVAAGATTVLASITGINGSAPVTVTTATLSSLDVTPKDATILAGETLQFAATGTFSDGLKLDLTQQVVWTSSNASAATIDQGGLATAGAWVLTNTTIQATSGSGASAKSASTTLKRR